MKSSYDIIRRPIITERSMAGVANKIYTFEVAVDANKHEIRKAVEEIFKVKVDKVNTIKIPAKPRRVGVHPGFTTVRKKAVVKLSANSKPIEFFEGMM
ncbi:MAG TPA: 50S ribosomal protein L23 [Candidatus Acidoferrum sp.]|nr:50S ribosomal protein L23 [Candidatus Acidoferrum sp.]